MANDGSITGWIRNLEGGVQRDDAARALWERFFADLARHALGKLRAMHVAHGVADEEDVAERAFTKVCLGIASGQLRLESRVDLHKILRSAATREAINQFHLGRRGAGPGGDESGIHRVAGKEPPPEFYLLAQEGCRGLLDLLGDDLLRRIALWKVAGHSNEEVAGKLDCSLAKVERKLALIRARWSEFAPEGPTRPGPRSTPGGGDVVEDFSGSTLVLARLTGQPDP